MEEREARTTVNAIPSPIPSSRFRSTSRRIPSYAMLDAEKGLVLFESIRYDSPLIILKLRKIP